MSDKKHLLKQYVGFFLLIKEGGGKRNLYRSLGCKIKIFQEIIS